MRISQNRPTRDDAALIKGMLQRGYKQHEIASLFPINQGRVSEINTGKRFQDVKPATKQELQKRIRRHRNR